jgi:glucan endo-1,3-alpha-glucosidase
MVGITYGQELAQWQTDMAEAQSAGIDGFALNIGTDSYTSEQLGLAFQAADAMDNFGVFLSFDMAAATWVEVDVDSYINDYKNSSSFFKVNGLPFVSTFEGPNWTGDWASVNSSTGGIFFVPDWSSLGPTGVGSRLAEIDGACKCSLLLESC